MILPIQKMVTQPRPNTSHVAAPNSTHKYNSAFNHVSRRNIPHCELVVSVHDDHQMTDDFAQLHFDVTVSDRSTLQRAAVTDDISLHRCA